MKLIKIVLVSMFYIAAIIFIIDILIKGLFFVGLLVLALFALIGIVHLMMVGFEYLAGQFVGAVDHIAKRR